MKIKIDIKNNRDFREVAFLVDKKGLPEDLEYARQKRLGLKNPLHYKKVEGWIAVQKPFRRILSTGSPLKVKIEGIPDNSQENKNYAKIIQVNPDDDPKLCYLIRDELKAKYNINDKYDEVLLYALLAGKVTEAQLKTKNRVWGIQGILTQINKLFDPSQESVSVPDGADNVERDRDWYWQKRLGMSYSQILEEAKKNGHQVSEGAVIQGIRRYKRRI